MNEQDQHGDAARRKAVSGESSEAAKAYSTETYGFLSRLTMIDFDAGRASAPLPEKVMEAVREYEAVCEEFDPETDDGVGVEEVMSKEAIADAVLEIIRGANQEAR